jgi:hypothetical protein
MLDILAEQIDDSMVCGCNSADGAAEFFDLASERRGQQSFRTINVLMIETRGNSDSTSIVEQCLRYMTGFECRIAQAGSHAAASFALRSDTFDIVITDEHCLDLITDNGTATIVITARPGSATTRNALKAGALHCLPLSDVSPRLLETAISQALCCEP